MADKRCQVESLQQRPTGVQIHWKDGHKSEYHWVWLRHQCECEKCGSPINGIRDNWILNIPETLEAQQLSVTDGGIQIVWKYNGHESHFKLKWLRENCYSETARKERKHRVKHWTRLIEHDLPVFDCKAVERTSESHLEFLETVRDYGFCKLVNLDISVEGISHAASLFGKLRDSYYGISDINEKSAQYNVGDSGIALLPHVDEPYRINPIGITLFQVVQPSAKGGHSILVDGFEAVRRLMESNPQEFEILSKVPVVYQRHHTGETIDNRNRWMKYRGPIIRLDADGDVAGVRINERQISPMSVDGSLIEPFYSALRKLLSITYDLDLRLELPLKSREGMVFDNQRILHGRTEFVRGEVPRHVRTCTVDTEEFHSTMRLLQLELHRSEFNQLIAQGY